MAILKNKLILVIVILLLLGGGGGYYFFVMERSSTASEKKGHQGDEAHAEEEEQPEDDGQANEEHEEEEEEAEEGHGGGHGEAKGPIIEPFVVNLADSGSRRYLRLNLKLDLRKREESQPLLEARMPQVRDAVLMLLSSKTTDQLLNTEGKTTLREELIAEINKVLKKKKLQKVVKNLYFTEFLIQ